MTEHVHVLYRAERDVREWATRHAAGEVPGRWPYGLDELAHWGLAVEAENIAQPTRLQSGVARVVPPSVRSNLARPVRHGIGVTWDEHVAQRMVDARPFRRMLTGVVWLTDAVDRADASRRRRIRAVLEAMDAVWVNSRAQVEPLRRLVGPDGPPVEFFRFGVDADFFRGEPYPERPLVVSVGGDRDRDPETLFTALGLLRSARPDVRILVQSASAASPPEGVEKVARLSHRELRDLYARASVVAIATRPNLHVSGLTVSLEAMATARPVVITESPGMEDYLHDGRNAALVPRGRAEALCDRIVGLLDEPAEAERMGIRGRALVEEGLTTRHLSRSLAEFVQAYAA